MSVKKTLETVRILEKAVLIIPVITALVLGACQTPDSAVVSETADLPASTESVKIETSTPTPTSTPIPEIKFEKVTNPAEIDKMSTITLEDLKPGSAFSKWEQEQLDKMGPIANNPQDINYIYWHIKSVDVFTLSIQKEGTTSFKSVKSTDFFSIFKINLEPFGFPNENGLVVTYVYEDKYGIKVPIHFLLTRHAAEKYESSGYFSDTKGNRLVPVDKADYTVLDQNFLEGQSGGPGDLRSIASTLYESQGISRSDIQSLFQRIATSDSLSNEDADLLKSILFFARGQHVSE